MKRILILGFLVFCIFISRVDARSAGNNAAEFLNIGVGAGPVGMGEANSAMASGADGVFYNPAAIADQKLVEINSMHSDWFSDTTYQYFGLVVPVNKIGPMGISYNALNYGSIPAYTSSGTRTGEVTALDSLVTLSWAKRINKKLAWGLNLKYISQKLDTTTANSIAADLGLKYNLNQRVTLAIVTKNQLAKLKYISAEASVPSPIVLGLAFSPFIVDDLSFSLDYNMMQREDNYLNLGAEYSFNNYFALRFGSSKSKLQGGVGFTSPFFELDYAYVPYEDLGATHRVSFTLSFGVSKEKEKKRYYKEGKQLYRKKKYLDALVIFKKIIEIDPLDQDSREFINRIVEEMRRETLQEKVKALIAQKKRARELLEQAVVAFQEKDYQKSEELIEQALKHAPKNKAALKLQKRIKMIKKIEKGN